MKFNSNKNAELNIKFMRGCTMQTICVVGAGWYGSHIALFLKKAGYHVILVEQNSSAFSGISGAFGIRNHVGPHYPRSPKTRESCHRGAELFNEVYPELVNEHMYSIYALGDKDADDKPSKVDVDTFKAVCYETNKCEEIDVAKWGYQHLLSAMNVKETSLVLGEKLRSAFVRYFNEADLVVKYNFTVMNLERVGDKVYITSENEKLEADYVINTTSFQALLPENERLPFKMEVVYQPCIAMVYRDIEPQEKPFSFFIGDGWFPCVMPYDDRSEEDKDPIKKYILTHGKWTILGSFSTVKEANKLLHQLDDKYIEDSIKPRCEEQINRFWPAFEKKFEYIGWKGTVLAKIKTDKEFRSAVTFECNRVIHVIPGKVTNIFDAANETLSLLQQQNRLKKGSYYYVKNGALDESLPEITEQPSDTTRNTCSLQTWNQLPLIKENRSQMFSARRRSYLSSWSKEQQQKQVDVDIAKENNNINSANKK